MGTPVPMNAAARRRLERESLALAGARPLRAGPMSCATADPATFHPSIDTRERRVRPAVCDGCGGVEIKARAGRRTCWRCGRERP